MNTVKVKLFGAFRKFGNGHELEIELEKPCSLLEFKMLLALQLGPAFNQDRLLQESAFGNACEILQNGAMVHPGETVAILPPVCGG
jgi:molybdopterin converting factor small subunit